MFLLHPTYSLPEEPLVASFFCFLAKEQSDSSGPNHMLATASAVLGSVNSALPSRLTRAPHRLLYHILCWSGIEKYLFLDLTLKQIFTVWLGGCYD